MKPKTALKRKAILNEATGVAPITSEPKPQYRRGLALLPKPQTTTPGFPGVSVYTNPSHQNWFRKYDVSGKVIEEGLCLGEDILLFRWIYTYSIAGNKVQAVLLNATHCLLE